MSDRIWMKEAYQLAKIAQNAGEIPVGAIIVDEQQRIVGQGWNQVISTQDPCAHAEMLAIKSAAHCMGNYRLNNTTLYVTLEPCCMCAGAIVHARIKRLVFATRDVKAGAAGSTMNLLKGYPLNHQVQIDESILQEECAHLLTTFFSERR